MSVELRRASRSDAEFLLEILSADDTREFLSGTPSIDDIRADISSWLVAEEDGRRVGCVQYAVVNERNRIVEGRKLAVHPDDRGRRLGDDLARAFQRLVLGELGFHRLEIQVYGFNERALAHAERVGYVREGVKRQAYEKSGEWQDAVLFSMLQEELGSDRG
ncbi:MAG: GNAT family N-acetyltransferase [Actinobacteria bacterium]|nr:GNAT family N-acetyltransferase [Actinomycetota bacterium]